MSSRSAELTTEAMQHRPLLFIALTFSGGILLDNLLPPGLLPLLGLTAGTLVGCWTLAFLFVRSGHDHPLRGAVYMSCCLLLSLLSGATYHHIRFYPSSNTDISHLVNEEGTLMRIRGVVIEPSFSQSVAPPLLPWKEAREDMKRCQFLLRVKTLEGRSGWHEAGGITQVRVYDPEPPVLRYGQVVELLGRVSTPQGPRNPGQMDYKRYLRGKIPSISTIASVEGRQNVNILSSGQGNAFFHFVYFLKERLEAGITRSAAAESATTMTGIVWGARDEIPREIREDFVKTGTYHFLAISGMQVGIIVATLHFLLFLMRVPRVQIAPVVMVTAVLYALLTGFEPPVLRAAFLTVFCYGALLVKREWDLPSGISAAVLTTLLVNPSDLSNPGFQLSLAGFLGLVYLEPHIESLFWGSSVLVESLQSPGERQRFRVVWVCLRKALCGSIGAWIATSPLVLYYFHLFSPWGAILSLLLFPLVWVLTISGFCLSILGQFSITASTPLAYIANSTDVCLKCIISWVSSSPFTYLYGPSPSWPWLLALYVVGTLALSARGHGVKLSYVAGVFLLMGNIYVYSEMPLWNRSSMKVAVLDVGHGSCVSVEFPNGRTMLYDAGTRGYFDVGRYVIAPFLWQKGVKKIDLVVISHEDEDHFDALPFLTERFHLGRVLVNDHLTNSDNGRPLIKFLESKGIRWEIIQEGVELNGLGGARVRVLNPPHDSKRLSANDASCVLRIDYQGHSVLLCGDIEGQAMERLRLSGADIGSDVVLAPHHGSYNPELGKFLEKVSPRYVVVSAKRSSTNYHFSRGEVLSTPQLGAISLAVEKGNVKANGFFRKERVTGGITP